MGTIEAEEVLTKDRSSGRVHRRFRVPGGTQLLSFEGDNLDSAGLYDIVESAEGENLLCIRCFPESHEPDAAIAPNPD